MSCFRLLDIQRNYVAHTASSSVTNSSSNKKYKFILKVI